MNNFWVKLGAVVVVILGLYYTMSPYQKCMRTSESWSDWRQDVLQTRGKEPRLTKREYDRILVNDCQGRTSW